MNPLAALLETNPSGPALTVYGATGARIEMSALTLHNWQSKIANYVLEAEIPDGSEVVIDCEASWQAVVIALGVWARGCTLTTDVCNAAILATDDPERAAEWNDDLELSDREILVVSTDPFGRGITESTGEELDFGLVDALAEFRVQPDAMLQPPAATPALTEAFGAASTRWADLGDDQRIVLPAWSSPAELLTAAAIWTTGGSLVIDARPDAESHARAAAVEKATLTHYPVV